MRDSAPARVRSAFGVGGRGAIMYEPPAIHISADGEVTVPLEITQREMNGIYLLALRGRLVLGEESSGFRTTVDNLLSTVVRNPLLSSPSTRRPLSARR